jgi:hypothetical protein
LTGLVVALIAVPALGVGLPIAAFNGLLRDRTIRSERVLDTSSDGRYSIVAVAERGGATALVIRSRRGLLSQEAATPVARCAHDPFPDELPPSAVRFTATDRVTVPVGIDAPTVTVAFDPATLEPDQTIDMCTQSNG